MPEPWSSVPMFHVAIPHCPWCGSRERVKVRTLPTETDGSFTQQMICCDCSRRYLIVHEVLPSSGGHVIWPLYPDCVTRLPAEKEIA